MSEDYGYKAKKAESLAYSRRRLAKAEKLVQSKKSADDAPIVEEMSMGMSWLYRMCSALESEESFAYCEDSRSWLAARIDSNDGAEEIREARASVWWEHQAQTEPPQQLSLTEFLARADAEMSISQSRHSSNASDQIEQGASSLTLQDVLDTPLFLADFKEYLQENFIGQGVNFIEEVSQWNQLDPKAYPKRIILKARRLYEHYIDMQGEDIVTCSSDTRTRVNAITQSAVGKWEHWEHISASDQESCFEELRNVMEEVKKQVLDHLETNLFPRFVKSDEYKEMLAVRFEEDTESKGAATVFKGVAWENDENYKSIHCVVEECIGVETTRKVWALVTVDTKTYRTTTAPVVDDGKTDRHALWKNRFQFPLASTTQHLKVTVWTKGLVGNTFLGRTVVPIASIQQDSDANSPEGVKYKLLPRQRGERVSGDIRLKLNLSTDEAKDLGHKLVKDDDDENSMLANKVRGLVSKKKKRFKDDGFDLDLSYITDRIIAMGFPSESIEGVYRNNMKDVQRFLEKRHPHSYRLYNLCSERYYDADKFKGRVARYPFDDHNPPNMETIKEFCQDVHEWLDKHPQHVVAVHCKAGKGRTGTIIACYFLYARMLQKADDALEYFAVQRTKNKKGVTIPSQMRYVHYFDHYCTLRRSAQLPPPKASLFLHQIRLVNVPSHVKKAGDEVFFNITQNNRKGLQYKSKGKVKMQFIKKQALEVEREKGAKAVGDAVFSFDHKPLLLTEDIRTEFYTATTFGKDKLFQYWFNTRYVLSMHNEATKANLAAKKDHPMRADFGRIGMSCEVEVAQPSGEKASYLQLSFPKIGIDKVCKDKKDKNWPSSFKIQLLLGDGTGRFSQNFRSAFADRSASTTTPRTTVGSKGEPSISYSLPQISEVSESKPEGKEDGSAESIELRWAKKSDSSDRSEPDAKNKDKDKDKKKKKKTDKKPKQVLKVGNLLSVKL